MRCPSCRTRTHGFPDTCPSCGGPILSVWHSWNRFVFSIGLISLLSGSSLFSGAVENDDVLRLILGSAALATGLYLMALGAVLWRRDKKEA